MYRNGEHMFVVLEGIDGSGKSSVAKIVAEKISGRYFRTPAPEMADAVVQTANGPSPMRRYIEDLGDVVTRYLYYLLVTAHASVQIKEMLKTSHVVCDRYLFSAIAYHQAIDPTLKEFSSAPLALLEPDITLHLTVSEEEQVRRIGGRGIDATGNSGWRDRDLELLKRVADEYALLDVCEVSTSEKTIDQVVSDCLELLPNWRAT